MTFTNPEETTMPDTWTDSWTDIVTDLRDVGQRDLADRVENMRRDGDA